MAASRNNLLVVLKDILEGRGSAEALAESVGLVRQEIDEMRHDFAEHVQTLDPKVREAVGGYIDEANHNLDAYQHALDILGEYVKSGDRRKLMQGNDQVGRCMYQTSFAFQVFRDAVLVAMGPTDIPNLNQLLQGYEEFINGQSNMMKMAVVAEREYRLSGHELGKLGKTPSDLVEVHELKRAWQAHHDCMSRLLEGLKAGDRKVIDTEVDRARDTFAALKLAVPAAETARQSQGPTPSPAVNVFIHIAREMEAGQAHPDALVAIFANLKQAIRSTEAQFETAARMDGADEKQELKQAIERGLQAFADFEAAFGTIDAFLEDRDVRTLHTGIRGLESAARVLHEAQQKVLDFVEHESAVVCVKCGHHNGQGRVRCERCGTGLPVPAAPTSGVYGGSEEEEVVEPPLVSDTLRKVYEAVNGVTDGSLSTEKFLETVTWFEGLLESHVATLGSIKPETPAEGDPTLTDAVTEVAEKLVTSSVDHFRQAIAEFRAFADDNDNRHLADGVRLCNHAAHELKKVETLSAAPPSASEESMVG